MSWDISMSIGTVDGFTATVYDDLNTTYNHGRMFFAALGFGFRELNGMTGEQAAPFLVKALAYLRAPENQSSLRAMEPANGWGSLEHATEVINTLLAWCQSRPKATLSVR